ncbi:hypothetical protein D7Y15_00645 [Corallococcus sp. AB030]|nr:hypothetical protein D7Y15_00645 [Corallococcus sp. AB030]
MPGCSNRRCLPGARRRRGPQPLRFALAAFFATVFFATVFFTAVFFTFAAFFAGLFAFAAFFAPSPTAFGVRSPGERGTVACSIAGTRGSAGRPGPTSWAVVRQAIRGRRCSPHAGCVSWMSRKGPDRVTFDTKARAFAFIHSLVKTLRPPTSRTSAASFRCR